MIGSTTYRRITRLACNQPIAIGGLLLVGVAALCAPGCSNHQATAQAATDGRPATSSESDAADSATAAPTSASQIAVETIRPKRSPNGFVRSATQPAYVEGLYTADLMARVPGTVKFIEKNIGDAVTKGETLVELDSPDLMQGLAQKAAGVQQADQDFRAAQVNLTVAQAAAKTAQALIKESEAAEERFAAWKRFHQQEYGRYELLAKRDAVVGNVLSEKLRDLEAAEADYRASQAATKTAAAKAEEFSAKVDAARVDIDVKKAKLAAAEADRDCAQAMVNFTKIHAPFDGLIVSRKVDPGSFVQNASTGNPVPMLRVVRTDWVTIVVWVPEKDAPFVTKQTNVEIHLDALADEPIRTKVTRYSHWLDPEKSRDLRVEVDLENKDGRLTPGMYGSMQLVLQDFSQSQLVPAGTVVAQGNRTYLFEVTNGRAVKVPVRVQFEDGVQAKIVKIVRSLDPKTKAPVEKYEELSGNEQIVRSGQGELADGQRVRAVGVDW